MILSIYENFECKEFASTLLVKESHGHGGFSFNSDVLLFDLQVQILYSFLSFIFTFTNLLPQSKKKKFYCERKPKCLSLFKSKFQVTPKRMSNIFTQNKIEMN